MCVCVCVCIHICVCVGGGGMGGGGWGLSTITNRAILPWKFGSLFDFVPYPPKEAALWVLRLPNLITSPLMSVGWFTKLRTSLRIWYQFYKHQCFFLLKLVRVKMTPAKKQVWGSNMFKVSSLKCWVIPQSPPKMKKMRRGEGVGIQKVRGLLIIKSQTQRILIPQINTHSTQDWLKQ